jgi:hypothetical protein
MLADICRFSPSLNTELTYVLPGLMLKEFEFIQGVPLATKSGISLIILTPIKILERHLNRSMFVVWEMKRNVSVVCVCSALIFATRSKGPPASQPACLLLDAPISWSLCHLAEGAYTIRLFFVSVSVMCEFTQDSWKMYRYTLKERVVIDRTYLENRIDIVISAAGSAGFNLVWTQMVATSNTCYDVITFLTQRT